MLKVIGLKQGSRKTPESDQVVLVEANKSEPVVGEDAEAGGSVAKPLADEVKRGPPDVT